MTDRRAFLTGLTGTLICAPAIVRASSLMKIKPVEKIIQPIWQQGQMLDRWGNIVFRYNYIIVMKTDDEWPNIAMAT